MASEKPYRRETLSLYTGKGSLLEFYVKRCGSRISRMKTVAVFAALLLLATLAVESDAFGGALPPQKGKR